MHLSRREFVRVGAGAALGATLVPGVAAGRGPSATAAGEDLCFLSASELRRLMLSRRVSPVDVVSAYLARIDRLNPQLNAFVTLLPDMALAQARVSERRIATGRARALEGLPLAVKDLFDFLAGVRNTFGSVPFVDVNFTPPFSSIYIQRLLDAGAIPLGKTNTPEFGHEGVTDNLPFGPTRNPFDPAMNAGGSSGGSASATAAFLTALAQGSDAGGSVRIPAAFCGVVGFKPTQGRIPQDVPPLSHTPFFTPGPITRTVTDCALMMSVMAGPSSADPFSLPDTVDYLAQLDAPLRGARIAFSPDLDLFPVESRVAQTVAAAVAVFREAGATVDTVSLGLDNLTIEGRAATQADLSALWVQEQSVLYAHGRDLFIQEGVLDMLAEPYRSELNPQFLAMIEQGNATSATEYRHGDFLRIGVLNAFEKVLNSYDYIASPTLSVLSVPNGTDRNTLGPASVNGVAVDRLIGWCLTYPFNFTGHPAISIPAGFVDGLPVGLQIAGRRWRDAAVLAAARTFETHHPWAGHYPR